MKLHTGGATADVNASVSPLKKIAGGCVHLFITSIWIVGVFLPMAAVLGLVSRTKEGATFAAVVAAVTAYPYVVKPGAWLWFKRSLPALGQHYFKECCYHFEAPEERLPVSEKGEKTLCLYHPHGVMCWGFLMNGGIREEFEPARGLCATPLFHAPLMRWFLMEWTGCGGPVNKEFVTRQFKEGRLFGYYPGGFEEATISKQGTDRVYIMNRKGWVKYALQYGYKVVPIYTFGEDSLYYNCQLFLKARLMLNKFSFPGVMPFGAFWNPLVPRRGRINTVFGKQLQFPQIDQPTTAQVDEWHGKVTVKLIMMNMTFPSPA
ncbi:unnamed protein product [Chrysoparadoxa australica]